MDYENEIISLKRTVERHSDRLTAIEKSTAEDHRVLCQVSKDVESMKKDISNMKTNVDTILLQNLETKKQMSSMIKWLKIIGAISVGAFLFLIIRNEQTASAVLSIGATITKLFV